MRVGDILGLAGASRTRRIHPLILVKNMADFFIPLSYQYFVPKSIAPDHRRIRFGSQEPCHGIRFIALKEARAGLSASRIENTNNTAI
jgi:hypothetical protein